MIGLKEILEAKQEIQDVIHETPILHSTQLSEICGNNMYFKAEHLQKTGSFKIRGATNKVKKAVKGKARFITTASSGNHGQAVAYIANQLRVPATIVVPEDVRESKLKAINAYGGTVAKHGLTSEERLIKAEEVAEQNHGVFIPPYNDALVMAGQGTVGLEILAQLSETDVVVVPIGGGGLISGVLTAIKQSKPNVKVIGVEPETANDTYLSLKNGELTEIPVSTTIADGLRAIKPGYLTFPVVQRYIDDIVLVSDDDIKEAQLLVLERMKQLIEPSSATTVAAAMHGKLHVKDKNVVCVLTGGNMDVR
ncbi:threonine/serine dehydratase [Oceanobacillus luteolus]|uniref:threonine/serine dehydratase n=1 Tax=Oceanobacillus luteolus TaxID=1274358 RepID=UPI00203F13DD|nr:threonine/serine dehydratase [Oceanobacillus luteolus]MCM3739749.1 threonine/serine dehydratase [Oceanobacillus luteolus]